MKTIKIYLATMFFVGILIACENNSDEGIDEVDEQAIASESSNTNARTVSDAPPSDDDAGVEDGVDDVDDNDDSDEEEEEIALYEIPTNIVDYITANYPGSEIAEAEREGAVYEIEILSAEGVELELYFDLDGNFLSEEIDD